MPPLISLITPSLNAGRFITETLRSISEQDYPHLEHIIVDGHSTDDTLALVERHGKRVSQVLREKDSGTSEAINKGFALASGEFLWVLNADDALAGPTTLTALANHLQGHPDCDFVFGNMRMIDAKGRPVGQRCFRAGYGQRDLLVDRRHLPFAGCLMRRQVLDRIGGFDTKFKFANDLDFLLRLSREGKMEHAGIRTGVFRLHAEASTSANIMDTGRETQKICLAFLQQPALPPEILQNRRGIQAALHVHAAGVCFHAGAPEDVRHHLKLALQKAPCTALQLNPWVYLAGSLTGAKGMAMLARWCRAMVHKRFLYSLNNFRPWMAA